MRKIALSTIAFLTINTYVMAGGDIVPDEESVIEVQEVVVNDAGFYIGAAYTFLTNETTISNGVNGEVDYNGFMLQAGYKFNPYIALEARYWNGGDERLDMTHPTNGTNNVHSEFDAWGIYLKPMYPVTEAFDVYALLGGAYAFTDNVSLFVDYVSIYDDTAIENSIDPYGNEMDVEVQSTSLNIGITYKF